MTTSTFEHEKEEVDAGTNTFDNVYDDGWNKFRAGIDKIILNGLKNLEFKRNSKGPAHYKQKDWN